MTLCSLWAARATNLVLEGHATQQARQTEPDKRDKWGARRRSARSLAAYPLSTARHIYAGLYMYIYYMYVYLHCQAVLSRGHCILSLARAD